MVGSLPPLDLSGLASQISLPAQPAQRRLTREELAALPPWDARQPAREPSRVVADALTARSLFDADPDQTRRRTGREADNAKLFELHKALGRLSALAARAQEAQTPAQERARLADRFARGLAEVDGFLTGLRVAGADLVKGLRLPRLESAAIARPAFALMGQTLHTGRREDAVAAFQTPVRFPIEARKAGAAPRMVEIDLARLRGPRTMDAVAAHLNTALAGAGMASRFQVVEIAPTQFGFRLLAAQGETIGFPGSTIEPPGRARMAGQEVRTGSFEGLAVGAATAAADWTSDAPGGTLDVREIDRWEGGARAVALNGAISQEVTTAADRDYRISVDFRTDGVPAGAAMGAIEIEWNGQIVGRADDIVAREDGVWRTLDVDLPDGASVSTLTIRRVGAGDGLLIDDVRVEERVLETPVGQPLRVDPSLLSDGDFAATAGWTTGDGAPVETRDGGPGFGASAELTASLLQSVATQAGRRYELTFDMRPGDDGAIADQAFEALWNGAPVGVIRPREGDGWRPQRLEVVGTGGADVLEFRKLGGDPAVGPWLDNVRLNPVQPLSVNPALPPPPEVSGAQRLGFTQGGWQTSELRQLRDLTPVRAGDFFTLTVDERAPVRVTITPTMTVRDLARAIDRALGSAGDAAARGQGEGAADRIVLTPRPGRRIEIGPGSARLDALADLGLAPGVAMSLDAGRPDPRRPPVISLDFKADLALTDRDKAKAAQDSIDGVMRRVRQAFRESNETVQQRAERLRQQEQAGRGAPAPPAFLQTQLANYREALARLTGGG